MTLSLDLARRALLLSSLLLLSLPLWSLTSIGAEGWRLGADAIVECALLAFVTVAGGWFVLNGRLFSESRLARPAGVLCLVVAASGLCTVLAQSLDADEAARDLWRAATSYFADPDARAAVRPTIYWIELAAFAPMLELALVRRASEGAPARRVLAGVVAFATVLLLTIASAIGVDGGAAERVAVANPVFGVGLGQIGSGATRVAPAAIPAQLGMAGLAALGWFLWCCVALARRARETGSRRWTFWVFVAVVTLPLPWRIGAAIAPEAPEVHGAGAVQRELDGTPYRVADQESRWRLRTSGRMVDVPMRWDAAASDDCYVKITTGDRPVNEVGLHADRWLPVRFIVQSAGSDNERPEFTLRVSKPSCKLLVGRIRAIR